MKLNYILLIMIILPINNLLAYQDLRIIERGADWVQLELQTPSSDFAPYLREGYSGTSPEDIGYPQLPMLASLVQVPAGAKVWVEEVELITDLAYTDTDLYPAPQSHANWIELDAPANLRGETVLRVRVYPLRWRAVDKQLHYITKLNFKLKFDKPFPALRATRDARVDEFTTALRTSINDYTPYQSYQSYQSTVRSSLPFTPQRYTVSFEVPTRGIYQIKYETLLEAGLPASCLEQGQFILHVGQQQIMPMVITKSPRQFAVGDIIEFYAERYKDKYTENSIYQLDCWQLASQAELPPLRYDTATKLGQFVDGSVTGTGIPLNYFMENLRFETDGTYWTDTPNAPINDFWFWLGVHAPTERKAYVSLHEVIATPEPIATLRLALQGGSSSPIKPNHYLTVSANGNFVGDVYWSDTDYHIAELAMPSDVLQHGTNEIAINAPKLDGVETDISYLDWIEVQYPRNFQAVNSMLNFKLRGQGERYQVRLTGFNLRHITIYDVTDPYHIKQINNPTIEQAETGDYHAIFDAVVNGERSYYALINTRIRSVQGLKLLPNPTLAHAAQGADYIIITVPEFVEAATPLLQHRQNQGLRTLITTVDQIYQEFGDGLASPQAIKNFLSYAYSRWQAPAPRYVLLLGSATFSYKIAWKDDGNKYTLVPTNLAQTRFGVTPDDNWFVSVDGDDELADMAIGRLPARNLAEATTVVNKILQYENNPNPAPRWALFIADHGAEFETANNQLEPFLDKKSSFARKVYLGEYGRDTAAATQQIIDYINAGVSITQYIGHGHIELWGKSEVFKNEHISLLTNEDNYTFMMALNCLNAYFTDLRKDSLGEKFLLAPNKGGVAVFSSSGLGYLWEYQLLNDQWYRLVFINDITTLGDAITAAKIAAYGYGASSDILSTLVLLGDPATRLRLP
jgi:hypothetical protein